MTSTGYHKFRLVETVACLFPHFTAPRQTLISIITFHRPMWWHPKIFSILPRFSPWNCARILQSLLYLVEKSHFPRPRTAIRPTRTCEYKTHSQPHTHRQSRLHTILSPWETPPPPRVYVRGDKSHFEFYDCFPRTVRRQKPFSTVTGTRNLPKPDWGSGWMAHRWAWNVGDPSSSLEILLRLRT